MATCFKNKYFIFNRIVSVFLAVVIFFSPFANIVFAAASETDPWVYDTALVPNQVGVAGQFGDYNDEYIVELPPGVNGLTPDLKISYSSQSGGYGSYVGHGWALSIPHIYRNNKMGVDKMYERSDFSSTYDGELSQISSSDFIPRIQTDGFSEYTWIGDSWTKSNLSGFNYTFGSSTNSVQKVTATSTDIYAWFLTEIKDSNGNKVVYDYIQSGGQIYPSKISYAYDAFGDPTYEVFFVYASTTPYVSYESGFSVVNDRLVTSIEVYFKDDLVKKYDIGYQKPNNSNVSLLSSVQVIGYDDNGIATEGNQRTFEYLKEEPTWLNDNDLATTAPSYLYEKVDDYWGTNYAHYSRDQIVDMNGDGLSDWVTGNVVYLNTGNGWESVSSWPNLPVSNIHSESRIVDVNGDLLPDIVTSRFESWDPSFSQPDVYTKTVRLNQGDGSWLIDTELANAIPGDFYWQYHNANGSISFFNRDVFFVDMNGDGLSDWIYEGYVYLNNGRGWATTSSWARLLSGSEPFNSKWRLSDVNGDGLPDLVRSDTVMYDPQHTGYTNLYLNQVMLNKGNGLWEQGVDWENTIPSDFNSRFYIQYWNYPGGITYYKNRVYLADINGDGLSDWLYTNKAHLNTGNGWATTTISLPISVEELVRSYRLVDIDGDTLLDFIRYQFNYFFGTITHTKEALVNRSQKQWLLSTSTNEFGGITSIKYDVTTKKVGNQLLNPHNPVVKYVASEVTTNPLFGDKVSTKFLYKDGALCFASSSPFDRKFAGFQTVTTETSLGKTVQFFHQGNGNASSSNEEADNYAKIGMPYRSENYDLNNNLFRTGITLYDLHSLASTSSFVKKSTELEKQYDGDVDHRDSATTFTYDNSNGLLMSKTNYGEVVAGSDSTFTDTGNDTVITSYDYTSAGNPIVLPARETVRNGSNDVVRDTKYYYDNQPLGFVTLGNLTKQENLISGGLYADTNWSYNTLGQVIAETDPRNNTTLYEYDIYNLHVSSTTNAVGHNIRQSYDYSSGKIATTTLPNGDKSVTLYDGLDRPVEVRGTNPETGDMSILTEYDYFDGIGNVAILETKYLSQVLSNRKYTYLDGFGKKIQERIEAEDSNKYSVTDYLYGDHGLLYKQSIPYFDNGSARSVSTNNNNLFSSYSYDALARVKSVNTSLGITEYDYDQWTETVIDAEDNNKQYKYDAFGRLAGVLEYNGSNSYETSYEWDSLGNLVKVIDAEGNVRNISYDSLGRRTTMEDLHGSSDGTFGTWSFSYDESGNLTSVTDPKSQVVNYTYDNINRTLTEDYLGTANTDTVYIYDACTNGLSRLCVVSNAIATTTYSYKPNGLVATETKLIDGNSFGTQYTYDLLGNKTSVIYPDSSEVSYAYNKSGKIEKIEQREFGGVFGDIVADFDYGPSGVVTYQKNGNNSETFRTYDDNSLYRLQSIVTVATTTFGTGGPGVEFAEIEPELLVIESTEVPAEEVSLDYVTEVDQVEYSPEITIVDSDQNQVLTSEEPVVQVEPIISLEVAESVMSSSSVDKDKKDKNLEIENLDKNLKKPFATSSADFAESEPVTEYVEQTSLASNEMRTLSQMSAMSANTLTKTVIIQPGPEGKDTHYGTVYRTGGMPDDTFLSIGGWGDWYYSFVEFNLTGLPTSDKIVSAQLNLYSMASPSSLSNDGTLDRVTQSWTEVGLTKANNPTYTSTGLPWSFVPTDNWWNNDVTTIVKNWVDNIYPNYGFRIRARYNNGNKGRSFYSSDEMTATSLRPKLTLIVIINPPTPPSGLEVGGQTNPVGINDSTPDFSAVFEDPDGSQEVATHYQIQVDNNSDFASVYWDSTKTGMSSTSKGFRGPEIAYSGPTLASSTDYYWRIKFWDQDNLEGEWSTSTSYFSLATGTASSTNGTTTPPVLPIAGDLVQSLYYSYDAVGNIIQIVDSSNTLSQATTTYEYDDLYRLVTASTTLASTTPYSQTYAYNSLGNILSNSSVGIYSYSENGYANPHAATSIGGVNYYYDNNGNLASTSESSLYQWNYQNKLIGSTIGGDTISYGYDHNGDRVFKTAPEGTTYYPFSNYEVTSTGSTTKNIYAGDVLVATIESATPDPEVNYVYTDHLGSTNVTLGDDGYITQVMDYYPYGSLRTDESYGNIDVSRKFTGHQLDRETDLTYMGARYYDGDTGKFISQDPASYMAPEMFLFDPQQFNMYSYARNNPLVFIDPTGQYVEKTGEVEKGDRLADITSIINNSNGTNYTIRQIADLNGIENIDKIYAGQTIIPNNNTPDITSDLTQRMHENVNDEGIQNPFYFRDKVKSGGEWDFKSQPGIYCSNSSCGGQEHTSYVFQGEEVRYDAPGNIHYGYVGSKAWYGKPPVLHYFAGTAQNSDNGTNSGDDPTDRGYINWGINLYNGGY